jgi:hypothetical protein
MVFNLLSSAASQEPESHQSAREGVIRSYTRQGRGPGLVAHHFPKLDGRLKGFHVYIGHSSQLVSGFDGQIRQVGREREGAKRIAGRLDRSQSRYLLVEKLQLRIICARD